MSNSALSKLLRIFFSLTRVSCSQDLIIRLLPDAATLDGSHALGQHLKSERG